MTTNSWLHITSGRGPAECRLAVQGISQAMLSELVGSSLLDVVESTDAHGWMSALLSIPQVAQVSGWIGTLEWLCPSPLRPGHGRKRWFVGCTLLEQPEASTDNIRDSELEWTTMKASGPGGQHVNKTESAVRLLHRPSGLVVSAREERSQHRNRALAMARLVDMLSRGQQEQEKARVKGMWQAHDALERGNPVKRFEGPNFLMRN